MSEILEIVQYIEQHTLMTQDVTVFIKEDVLKQMLEQQLSEQSQRELIQTYYVALLKAKLHIAPKNNYGDWNASIGNVGNVYSYMSKIVDKLKGHVSIDTIEKQLSLINDRILCLSLEEKENSITIQAEVYQALL